MIFGIKKIGEWDKVAELTKELKPSLHKAVMEGQKATANKLLEIVRDHLVNQDLGWKPLSEAYASRKRANKEMILVERWKYFDAIRIEKRGNSYSIGVRKDRYYVSTNKSRIPLYKVALFHEGKPQIKNLFGKGIKLPVRPLWGPSARELNKMGIDKFFVKEIRKQLKADGWPSVSLQELRKYKAPV